MGLETTRARASRVPSIHFRTRLYFAIDVIVVGSIFAILSHVTWRSFQVWRLPEIALPSAVLAIAFLSRKLRYCEMKRTEFADWRNSNSGSSSHIRYSQHIWFFHALTIPDSSSYQLFSPLWFGKSSTQ